MDEREQRCSNKKARIELTGVQVKKEAEAGQQATSGAAAAMAAVEAEAPRAEVVVRMDKAKLDCPLCNRPLIPPIFQCDGGHFACIGCRGHAQISNNKCYACALGGSYGRNPALESFILSAMIRCPNDVYGCLAYAAYCLADEHRRKCPRAPCHCPARGCSFLGSPPMLRDHISVEHDRPVPFSYGRERKLSLPAARRWHALVGQEDGRLFLVSRRALGAVTAVSLVCVRANAAASRYTCRLALELPSGDDDEGFRGVMMESDVGSSDLSGGAPDYGMFVGAHQLSLSGETLALSIRVDKLRPGGADADDTGKSAPVITSRGSARAGDTTSGALINLIFHKSKLNCPLCNLPLRPPIFQCDAGHLACSACHVSKNKCYICSLDGHHGRNRNRILEDFILSAKTSCPYEAYGCSSHVAYCEADNHRRACPCAPRPCVELGCPFTGSPSTLIDHIVNEHSQVHPIVALLYGQELKLTLTAEQRWHALVGEDRILFIVLRGKIGAETAVLLSCAGANASGPQYRCRVAVELPSGGDGDGGQVAVMESELPREKSVRALRDCMGLVQQLDDTVVLNICIDKLQPAGADASSTNPGEPTPTTPRARSSSGMQH